MLDQYESGFTIEQVKLLRAEPPQEVIAAYRDVQTARADKEKAINEAHTVCFCSAWKMMLIIKWKIYCSKECFF